MEHSRLLKYLLPGSGIRKMADTPTIKLHYEYKNPNNIEAEVPGAHELREAPSGNTDEEQATVTDDNTVEITESFTLAPVITVTKKEATFTKGDLRLQKVTVTEDISEEDIQNSGTYVTREIRRVISHNMISRTTDVEQEVRNGGGSDNKEAKAQGEKKLKTRIPKLRQTVERLKERRNSRDKEKHEAPSLIPTLRRSSIPKLNKESKLHPPTVKKEVIITKKEVITEPDDEFDKIYEEIVESKQTDVIIDDNILNTKIDDPKKLEIKFEQIIHDYEENNVHPKHVEKVKQSKIPFLKRKSEEVIEIPKASERTITISSTSDKVKVRNAISKLKEPSVKVSAESSVKTQVVTQKVAKTIINKTVLNNDGHEVITTSKVETTAPLNVVSTTESVKYIDGNIENPEDVTDKVEYRVKETVRIVRPDFRKHFSEMANTYKENCDNDGKVTITEIKNEGSDISNAETSILYDNQYNPPEYDITEPNCEISTPGIEESNITIDDESTVNITEIDDVENEDSNTKPPVIERISDNEEDIPIIKGKVGRMINRITSVELTREGLKKDFSDEIPKKKSVMSRIAMFERQEQKEPLPKMKFPRTETKIPKVFQEIHIKNTNRVDKPKILEEVLKSVARNNESITYGDTDQILTEKTATSIEEVKTLEEILEPLDKELEAIDLEQNNVAEVPDALQTILDSKFDEDNEEITNTNHNDSLIINTNPTNIKDVIIQKEDDSNEYENVETVNNTPLMFEECKVVGEVLKRNNFESVDDLQTTIDLTDSNINDSITSKHMTEVIEAAKIISDIVTLPGRSKKEKNDRVESFHAINNELEFTGNLDHNRVLSREISVNQNKVLYERGMSKIDTELKGVAYKDRSSVTELVATITNQFSVDARDLRRGVSTVDLESKNSKQQNENAVRKLSRKENDDVFEANIWHTDEKLSRFKKGHENFDVKRAKSLAELDLGDAVKGQVNRMIVSMKSVERLLDIEKKEVISIKERPRKQSVSEKIALFERKLIPKRIDTPIQSDRHKLETREKPKFNFSEEVYAEKIAELNGAKLKYGKVAEMPTMELRNGMEIPVLTVGTALLDPRMTSHIIMAAIDLGYRSIDAGYIYGNEQEVGAAIKAKIDDGTVRREDLFIINKLWSTFHRQDLVETACRASLKAMGLEYFDLYLIHNPMSFKEGPDPMPKIATVLQYSAHDYMDAWFGMEVLVSKGLVKSIGLSNFNSAQVQKVVEKGRLKPVVNQVECHPYLSQQRLDNFCSHLGVKLSCFGVLGSKGTPLEYKSGLPPVIDDALVQVMASGLGVTPAQLLIRYQIQSGHNVVVKSSTGAHLWDNLQGLNFSLSLAEMDALNALNRNKRTFTFKGMGDTHKNYPFSIAF